MITLAQPHVDETAPRRVLRIVARAVALAAIPAMLAVIVALVLRHLPVDGLVIAPRVMVPL